ncbi:hypothetical protein ACOMHN_043588 [Nucella lapillus]
MTAVGANPPASLSDPSKYRPEVKDNNSFRDFRIHHVADRVVNTYQLMHTYQTLDFVRNRMAHWGSLDHDQLTIMDALEKVNSLVDESDPDLDMPNSFHAFQTAEGIRQKHPDQEWFQVAGLIHDLGKVLALWGEPQWSVVGDTFPVGCRPDPSIVFGMESFSSNVDMKNPKLNTRLGIYEENCGLDKVYMSWGHDEYLYKVLEGNSHRLPEEALYVIRFHSFYPWHSAGAYDYLCNDNDRRMLDWAKEFCHFDLYTKAPDMPDVDSLHDYYEGLVKKFVPGKLRW